MKERVEEFCKQYQLFEENAIQKVQLEHRFNLAQAFELKEGMRVLEIGCGQGDMTVVLADQVGASGHVTAIDVASGEYGAPLTLSQAHEKIQRTKLGERISFHLETDFLTFPVEEQYDCVVFAHSSWYFHSPEILNSYFKKIRKISSKLLFAEWDVHYTQTSQRGHFCAVTVLALHSALTENDGNIQHVFSRQEIRSLLEAAGFSIQKEGVISSSYLQDGQWEIDYASEVYRDFSRDSTQFHTLATSLYHMMNESEKDSLDTFVSIAI
ncbi:SAM-dependent methyltransferase [Chryseomicrobium aureum]|uniref:SAM-dependent methyltransferase n=1 Tax=Chryseomicrobium aureum TaxID=1441723 RepID=UPI001956D49C|nr:class I SAM-dependent methyltransferase [Chryseomicrobium aureum]MBM7705768.1 SAM-dependent methyltransferase [Chryseomicrobium aureum]